MSILARARNFRTQGARSALAAALVAWLGFLLQPCAMASSYDGPGVAENGIELSVFAHHPASGAPAEQCLHCADTTSTSNLLPGSCEHTAAAGNAPGAKLPDSGQDDWGPVIPTVISQDIQQTFSRSVGSRRAECLPRHVSITTAFCVYLE